MNNHHNITLPDFLMPFLVSKFSFNTQINTSFNGVDFIKNGSDIPVKYYTIKSARIGMKDLEELYKFIALRNGPLNSFLIIDKADFSMEMEEIAIGDGIQKEFKIIKNYNDEISSFTKQINFPLEQTIDIWIDNKQVDFEYNLENSLLKLSNPPEIGQKIYASCQYYNRVRFYSYEIEYKQQKDGSFELADIELKEVIDE